MHQSLSKNYVIILIFFIILSASYAFGQENNSIKDFEIKLNTFRYGLYEDLNHLKLSDFNNFDGKEWNKIDSKINAFYNDNPEQIKSYRKYILSQYLNYNINTYSVDTILTNRALKLLSDSLLVAPLFDHTLTKLHHIDPLKITETMITVIAQKLLSTNEAILHSVRNRFARPLTQTMRNNESDDWTIIVDEYYYVFRFKYNLYTEKMILVDIHKRQGE